VRRKDALRPSMSAPPCARPEALPKSRRPLDGAADGCGEGAYDESVTGGLASMAAASGGHELGANLDGDRFSAAQCPLTAQERT